MSVQVDITCDAHHTVGDVHGIASLARTRLLERIRDLHEADVERILLAPFGETHDGCHRCTSHM